jgi:hypothetical protein
MTCLLTYDHAVNAAIVRCIRLLASLCADRHHSRVFDCEYDKENIKNNETRGGRRILLYNHASAASLPLLCGSMRPRFRSILCRVLRLQHCIRGL